MEGVALGLRDSLEILNEMKVPAEQLRVTGGGARSASWRQMQADVFGLPLSLLNMDEGPAFGVALLAGVGAGVYRSVEEACDATIRVTSVTEPRASRHAQYCELYEIYRGLYPSLREHFAAVSRLSA